MAPLDYFDSGLDIQAAMVDQARRYPKRETRPPYLLWGGLKVKTSDQIVVPSYGEVTATIQSCVSAGGDQGFDLEAKGGSLRLAAGEEIQLLRTWYDVRYEDHISYPYLSRVGLLSFWNVYKRSWPNGDITEEKWTGNAGFWIEELAPLHRIYHCSSGILGTPNFESLVIELNVREREKRER